MIGPGLGAFPEPGVSVTASTIDTGVFRVESNHLGEIRDGPGVIARMVTRQAPEVDGPRIAGPQAEGAIAIGQRLIIRAHLMVETAAGEINVVIGSQPDRLSVVAQGEVFLSEIDINPGSLQVGVGLVGLELDGCRVVSQGFLQAPCDRVADSSVNSGLRTTSGRDGSRR